MNLLPNSFAGASGASDRPRHQHQHPPSARRGQQRSGTGQARLRADDEDAEWAGLSTPTSSSDDFEHLSQEEGDYRVLNRGSGSTSEAREQPPASSRASSVSVHDRPGAGAESPAERGRGRRRTRPDEPTTSPPPAGRGAWGATLGANARREQKDTRRRNVLEDALRSSLATLLSLSPYPPQTMSPALSQTNLHSLGQTHSPSGSSSPGHERGHGVAPANELGARSTGTQGVPQSDLARALSAHRERERSLSGSLAAPAAPRQPHALATTQQYGSSSEELLAGSDEGEGASSSEEGTQLASSRQPPTAAEAPTVDPRAIPITPSRSSTRGRQGSFSSSSWADDSDDSHSRHRARSLPLAANTSNVPGGGGRRPGFSPVQTHRAQATWGAASSSPPKWFRKRSGDREGGIPMSSESEAEPAAGTSARRRRGGRSRSRHQRRGGRMSASASQTTSANNSGFYFAGEEEDEEEVVHDQEVEAEQERQRVMKELQEAALAFSMISTLGGSPAPPPRIREQTAESWDLVGRGPGSQVVSEAEQEGTSTRDQPAAGATLELPQPTAVTALAASRAAPEQRMGPWLAAFRRSSGVGARSRSRDPGGETSEEDRGSTESMPVTLDGISSAPDLDSEPRRREAPSEEREKTTDTEAGGWLEWLWVRLWGTSAQDGEDEKAYLDGDDDQSGWIGTALVVGVGLTSAYWIVRWLKPASSAVGGASWRGAGLTFGVDLG